MIRTPLKLTTLAMAVALVAAPAYAAKAGASGTVNGKAISQLQIDFLLAAQKAQGRPDSPDLRNAAREEVIRREILAQEAQKQGLDKKPEIQAKMELARQGVLIGAYIDGYVKAHPISDETVKKEYENVKAQLGDKEYKVRHVLVESEDEAKDISNRAAPIVSCRMWLQLTPTAVISSAKSVT